VPESDDREVYDVSHAPVFVHQQMFGSSIHMNMNADYLSGVWKSYIAYLRTTVEIYKVTNGIA
jgi:hypothetical protein